MTKQRYQIIVTQRGNECIIDCGHTWNICISERAPLSPETIKINMLLYRSNTSADVKAVGLFISDTGNLSITSYNFLGLFVIIILYPLIFITSIFLTPVS